MKMKFSDPVYKTKLESGELWDELTKLREDGSMIGCSKAVPAADHRPVQGLLSGHAYAILDMRACHADASADFDALDVKLVRLRNPWGSAVPDSEWTGPWCDDHELWKNYPTVKRALAYEFAKDGTFWMEWEDFKTSFNQLFLAVDYPDDGSRVRYRGNWVIGDIKSGAGGVPGCASWPQNPQYPFEVAEATKLVAVVSQRDMRWQEGKQAKYPQGVGFVVMSLGGTARRCAKFKLDEMAAKSRAFVQDRSVAATMTLEAGRYAIVPSTFRPGTETSPFILEVNTDKPVKFEVEGEEIPDLEDNEEEEEEEEEAAVAADEDPSASFEEVVQDPPEPEHEGRELEALWHQAGELSALIKTLTADNDDFEARIKSLEQFAG